MAFPVDVGETAVAASLREEQFYGVTVPRKRGEAIMLKFLYIPRK